MDLKIGDKTLRLLTEDGKLLEDGQPALSAQFLLRGPGIDPLLVKKVTITFDYSRQGDPELVVEFLPPSALEGLDVASIRESLELE